MNPLLESIANNAAQDLKDLILSGNDDILAAIHKLQTEAQLQETNPKFALGFKITVDFDKHSYDCDLSWSLKQTLGVSHSIDDPNQGNLQIDSDDQTEITIKTGDQTVKTNLGGLKRAAKAVKNN